MAPMDKAKWQATGYAAKKKLIKMHPDLADWEIFKRTFGFFQWRNKNNVTDEQLAEFEFGFKHNKP